MQSWILITGEKGRFDEIVHYIKHVKEKARLKLLKRFAEYVDSVIKDNEERIDYYWQISNWKCQKRIMELEKFKGRAHVTENIRRYFLRRKHA